MANKIKVKLILKLRSSGLSRTAIAKTGMSKRSVCDVFDRADELGITYDDVDEMPEDEVYSLIFPERNSHEDIYCEPDWEYIHKELAKTGVTLKLLHSEYADKCADEGKISMGYNRFCKCYRNFALKSNVTSRVGHKAARLCEVDWSGPTMAVVNPDTGEVSTVYLFIGTLPFSRYAYVEATLNMKQDTWLLCHVHMFEFFGGSVPIIVCDNLKTGVVTHPKEGEIYLTPAYEEMAAHYGAAIMPGRVHKPKDKPSAENTVYNTALTIIGPLRNTTFTSIEDLRSALRKRLDAHNCALFQKRSGSRLSSFKSEEKPLLRPLPAVPYEICHWVYDRKVQLNSHVSYRKNFYSVSHLHVGDTVDLRITDSTLEIYAGGERLATHKLFPDYVTNKYSTNPVHLPENHSYQDWNQERIRNWALRIGPSATEVIDKIFISVKFEEQAYNPSLAVLRLTHKYPVERVEKACGIALKSGVRTPKYAHIKPILETNQDQMMQNKTDTSGAEGQKAGYVRGADYYGGLQK